MLQINYITINYLLLRDQTVRIFTLTDTVFPAQEQVCRVRYEASVQEMLREVPPGIEEEAKEAVWRCCTEVNAQSVQAGEVGGGDEMAWICWDEFWKIKFVLVCIISVSNVPEERNDAQSLCRTWTFAFIPSCFSNPALCYAVYISHACLISPYETWFLTAFLRTSMFSLMVCVISQSSYWISSSIIK